MERERLEWERVGVWFWLPAPFPVAEAYFVFQGRALNCFGMLPGMLLTLHFLTRITWPTTARHNQGASMIAEFQASNLGDENKISVQPKKKLFSFLSFFLFFFIPMRSSACFTRLSSLRARYCMQITGLA